MANEYRIPQEFIDRESFYHFDDFHWLISPHQWTNLASDGGVTAFAQSDAHGGVIQGATGATDNNEIAVRTTNELFDPANGKPMWGAGRIQYTESNTDDANVFFGFCSALAANTLVDDGAGPRTTGSIFGIYKVDGGTVWRCITRNGTDSTDNISLTTAGGASHQVLEVFIKDFSVLQCVVTFKVDGVFLRDTTTGLVIEHRVNYASNTEMNFGVYVKAGSANSETMNVDWLAYASVR